MVGRRKVRSLVGALKDKASISKACLSCSSTAVTDTTATSVVSPNLTVLRATTHHPLAEPPHPRHVEALLSFGAAPRLVASTAVRALVARLRSTRDASVALKCLLVVHYVATRGAFILRDQLYSSLHAQPSSGGRNPLNLLAFRDGSSPEAWALSSWVRWYARVLELILSAARSLGTAPDTIRAIKDSEEERATSLPSPHLLNEIESLVGLVEEITRAPDDAASLEGSALVREAVRLVEEERSIAEHGILVRASEMKDRLGSLRFADLVELACLLRRSEECKEEPTHVNPRSTEREWFRSEIIDVRKRAEDAVVRLEEEKRARERRVRRERLGDSARVPDRGFLASAEPVRFGSSRWVER